MFVIEAEHGRQVIGVVQREMRVGAQPPDWGAPPPPPPRPSPLNPHRLPRLRPLGESAPVYVWTVSPVCIAPLSLSLVIPRSSLVTRHSSFFIRPSAMGLRPLSRASAPPPTMTVLSPIRILFYISSVRFAPCQIWQMSMSLRICDNNTCMHIFSDSCSVWANFVRSEYFDFGIYSSHLSFVMWAFICFNVDNLQFWGSKRVWFLQCFYN